MISIIIPVYNTRAYLDRCVQSVINQVYQDWECILVDDGSTDESGMLCDKWAVRETRIKVIHQVNQGVSVARNNGIVASSGEYIAFIDSDDWVEANYLFDLIENRKGAELVISGITSERGDNYRTVILPPQNAIIRLDNEAASYFASLNRDSLIYGPVNKLYCSQIIKRHGICFPVDCDYGEDLVFNFQYLEHVEYVSMIKRSAYHYMRQNSFLSVRFREDQFANDYKQWLLRKNFFVKKKMFTEEAQEVMCDFLWGIVYDGIFLFPKLKSTTKDYLNEILSIPEINDLQRFQNKFHCAGWIKWAILQRASSLFYVYFMMKRIGRK